MGASGSGWCYEQRFVSLYILYEIYEYYDTGDELHTYGTWIEN